MKELGLALSLQYPDKINGVDYEVRDDGDGAYIAFWNLSNDPPRNQGDVNQILNDHKERRAEQDARREPDWPTVEERVEDIEQALMDQGRNLPARERAEQVRNRVRQDIEHRNNG